MIDNSPYQSLHHGGITIEGYSRAMVQSVWRVPEWNIGFDLGALPWQFIGTPTWFVTHAHLDHLAALPLLASRRAVMELAAPTTIYLPEAVVDDAYAMLKLWERLDKGPQSCTLNGLAPGDEVILGPHRAVTTIATSHPVPSLGYVVWERRQKLRPEFQSLTGPEIRDRRAAGVSVTEEQRIPLLCYTGDTNPTGLDANPIVYEAQILITELSFVRVNHPREKIHAFGHMHIDDFIERADLFRNELVVVAHVSSRYEIEETKKAIEENVPAGLRERMYVWGV
jgi:ribonuclease Z